MTPEPRAFPIPAPDAVGFWPILLIPLVVAVGILVLIVSVGRGRLGCDVEGAGLRLRGALYGRLIPWNQIDCRSARIVDFAAEPKWRPAVRTNGIGLPGYRVGWFRLQSGDRALVFTTTAERAVLVRVHPDYVVLVGVDDPDALVSALQAR